MTRENPYVLGTGDDELQRLGLQHRLWSDAAHAAWKRAGIAIGQRVLDVGSGPGFAAFDLAQLVTRRGAVVAVDESASFLAHVESQASSRGLPQLRALQGDVADLERLCAGERPFDLAYARWLLCFVRDPEAVVRGVASVLRPGARFAVHDYFNYASITLAPRSAAHDRVVEATVAAWRGAGGDPDVVGRLPAMLDDAGFDVVHVEVHQRVGRAGDAMFGWVDTWWHTFAPKLVAMGRLEAAECDALLRELGAMRAEPRRFLQCPPVYEVIAERR